MNDEIDGDIIDDLRNAQTVVNNKINALMSPIMSTNHQMKGKCDPKSDLQCSCPRRRFVDSPEQLPMPATSSNVPALEGWIKDYFK